MTGKLSTAIRILLLFAFEAIPDIRLNEAEKPNDVSTRVNTKSMGSFTGLPIKTENKPYPASESIRHKMPL